MAKSLRVTLIRSGINRPEQHKLTIYPIALDKVPGRRGWKPCAFDTANPEGSLIAPKRRLKPRLIEKPIEIKGPVTRSP